MKQPIIIMVAIRLACRAFCSAAQWEFHRGLQTEISTQTSVTQLTTSFTTLKSSSFIEENVKVNEYLESWEGLWAQSYPALSCPTSFLFIHPWQQFGVRLRNLRLLNDPNKWMCTKMKSHCKKMCFLSPKCIIQKNSVCYTVTARQKTLFKGSF